MARTIDRDRRSQQARWFGNCVPWQARGRVSGMVVRIWVWHKMLKERTMHTQTFNDPSHYGKLRRPQRCR